MRSEYKEADEEQYYLGGKKNIVHYFFDHFVTGLALYMYTMFALYYIKSFSRLNYCETLQPVNTKNS